MAVRQTGGLAQTGRRIIRVASVAALLAALPVQASRAQNPEQNASPLAAKLTANPIESHETPRVLPADGYYLAGDDLRFTVEHADGEILLRFDGDGEIFSLDVERAPNGGRVLRYDTGAEALQVAGWGGVTVYTRAAPEGLPADHVGTSEPLVDATPTPAEVRNLASAWAKRMKDNLDLVVHLEPRWERQLSGDERRLAAESMLNTERAFMRLESTNTPRSVLERVRTIRIGEARKPSASCNGSVLTITFTPGDGIAGRPSSLAIARALDPHRR